MTAEEWRPVPGFPDYRVSDLGRVMSTKYREPRIVGTHCDPKGYAIVSLSHGGHATFTRVHRLVAEVFHGPCPTGYQCRHLNGDAADNRAVNLRWGSSFENAADMLRHGTHGNQKKTRCPRGHPYDAENTYRRPSQPTSKRECRECARIRKRNFVRKAA